MSVAIQIDKIGVDLWKLCQKYPKIKTLKNFMSILCCQMAFTILQFFFNMNNVKKWTSGAGGLSR